MRLIGKSLNMFNSFRGDNGFTFYPDHESPNNIDKPLVAVTYFCVLVAIATLLAALGIRGKEKWYCALRASYSVAVGSIILACIASHSWREGCASVVSSPYVYRANLSFQGVVGLKIGLHSANVTLDGAYRGYNGKLHHVEYVESLGWADYGDERLSYRPALHRGLPEPILRVMDFLTINAGGMRWGHAFHAAGQVTCALLWTSFAFWVLTNILLFSVIVYGAYLFFLTGFALLMACVAYHSCQNIHPLYIIYEDSLLELSYGWSFWLTLVTGAITTAVGVVLILMDHFLPDTVAEFFLLEKAVTDEPVEDCMVPPKQASFMAHSRYTNQSHSLLHNTDRRGSIFLEPERRRNSTDSLFKKAVLGSCNGTPPLNKQTFDGNGGAKVNPLFVDDKVLEYSEEQLKLAEMEKVCERGPFHMKDHKASLATLKELRDNHANERKFTSLTKDTSEPKPFPAASNSLQSSPRLSHGTGSSTTARPRSESDGAALSRLSQRKDSDSNVVIDVDSLPNNPTTDSQNIFFRNFKENLKLTNLVSGSKVIGVTALPNQVEVEVETHRSSSSDMSDLPPPPSFASDESDSDDGHSMDSNVIQCDVEVTKSKDIDTKSTDALPVTDIPSQETTIQIERC